MWFDLALILIALLPLLATRRIPVGKSSAASD